MGVKYFSLKSARGFGKCLSLVAAIANLEELKMIPFMAPKVEQVTMKGISQKNDL